MIKTKFEGRDLAVQALIATLYITLTLLFLPLSFGMIQVRFSEFLLILVLFNPRNAVGLILGCFIANFFGDFGIVDVIFGTLATALTCFAMIKSSNALVAFVWPAVLNGLVIGVELAVLLNLNPLISIPSVFAGELLATFVPALFLAKPLLENQLLRKLFD